MGAVYEVEHLRTGERLALKVLLAGVGSSPEAIERFKREARASAVIKSEHVVRVTDADVAPELDGAPFLVMDLLRGMNLEEVAAGASPAPELVIGWLRQVARALDKAHGLGIVHRDLKPDNLFLASDENGRASVKILDFGIAKMLAEGTGATVTGQLLGTPTYMAPEQASANVPVTPATDRYALGLIAYRLLVGGSYHQGDAMSILGQLLHGELQRPSERGSRLGGAFDEWFLKACHRGPERRFAAASEQIEALADALGLSARGGDMTLPASAGPERPSILPAPVPALPLFGRDRELARIEQALAGARAGAGALLLVTGEAGIGKSRLAQEAAVRAAAAGMQVLSGRCWEGGGAAAYWPWAQVFRGLGSTPFEDLVRNEGGDAQQRRFQLFDAATRALTLAAGKRPLLVCLDDLHAADLPSLLLLLFLARQVATAPLLVLATSREVEPRLSPEVAELMAKLGREGEVLSLPRLTKDAVAAWVSASEPDGPNASDLFRITEGNPLFVREVLRMGAHGARRPTATDGMKAALDEHLDKLAPDARAVLAAAAVLGRDFGSRELAEICADAHGPVLQHLREGTSLDVVEETGRERFQFTHVLLRDRLYETLLPARRSQLQWQAGLVAESHGADSTRVANHLLEGAEVGDPERAAASALRAAEDALRGLAFEAAASVAERGIAVLGAGPSRLACKLEIACGEGLIRSGSIPAGRARCVRAGEMAKVSGWAEEQAHAALTYGSETIVGVDPVMVRLLEEAAAALGAADGLLVAKLGARLAAALMPPRTEEGAEQILTLARASIAMARRLGEPETLLYALDLARQGIASMVPNDELFDLVRETVVLAQVLDQRLTLIKVAPFYAGALLERGAREEADAVLASVADLDAALAYPQSRWRLPMLRAGFSLFEGRLEEAERLGDEALVLAEQAGAVVGTEWALQRVAIAVARQEPAWIAPHAARILSILERGPFAGAMRAWVLAAIGRREEAAAVLPKAAALLQGLPTLLLCADACLSLDDAASASLVYEQLPKRSVGIEFFWGAARGYALGPTSRVLGDLAGLLGRKEDARRHYEDAIALCRRIGAKPFLDLSLAGLARIEPGSPADARKDEHAQPPQRRAPRDVTLTREGDVWAVTGPSGPPFRLKHSKGFSYLSELLAHPGQDLHVLALVGLDHGAGDAGPVLDARAKAAYKKRLEALEDEISEAEGFGDEGRANRAREEIELLATQLAGAVGLGGRDRKASSDAERARINVQRRLKDTIDSIGHCDADLGRYLAAAVKTGTYCSFTPF